MLNYHLNITICKDLACQTLWHNVRHENDNEINWHFYSFKTFKLSFPCIVPKIDNIFWWLIINSNGYMKFENFQKCHTNGAEYRGQTHIYIYTKYRPNIGKYARGSRKYSPSLRGEYFLGPRAYFPI